MKESVLQETENITKEKRRRHNWNSVVTVLACLVVFCTTYALILPALTMEAETHLNCSEENLSGHVHAQSCRDADGNLVCGYADYVIHTHDENCRNEKGDLICTLPEIREHQHDATCFADTSDEDRAAHLHGEACYDYEKVLICKQEEQESHAHGEECFDETGTLLCEREESEGHWHNDDCFTLEQGALNCAYEEEDTAETAQELICRLEEIAYHQHTSDCFDKTGNLKCGKTQVLRHQHTEACLKADEQTKGPSAEEINTVRVMTCEGEDYTVSVSFSPEAGLPDDVTLEVNEILPDSEAYALYYEQTKAQLQEDRGLVFCRFFDISFVANGAEIEPTASVDVQVSYKDPVPQVETVSCNAVHFAEDGIEMLPAEIQTNENGEDTFAFSQDSFSVVGTAITAVNLSEGSYIFYRNGYDIDGDGNATDREGYAIGVNDYYEIYPVPVTVDENGYVYPTDPATDIDDISWTYRNNSLWNVGKERYFCLEACDSYYDTSLPASPCSAFKIWHVSNVVYFAEYVNGVGATWNLYFGFDATSTGMSYKIGYQFDKGDYFLTAKIATVSDEEIQPGDLEIEDQIKSSGCLTPKLNAALEGEPTLQYTWYRSDDGGQSWTQVVRTRVTGNAYNVAEDGSWLNVALDKGADKQYKVALTAINGSQLVPPLESIAHHVSYYDQIQNGGFEEPVLPTEVSESGFYQPFLPNGTAGMVWKTTAADGEIEYISTAPGIFQSLSEQWHNCENAAEGTQYVELNANMAGALYQDVLTVPGSTMYWSLAHRGRGPSGWTGAGYSDYTKDTMYVVIMSTALAEQYNVTTQAKVNDVISNLSNYPGAQVVSITDDNQMWYYHSGEYTVPDEQYLTRYFFVAGNTSFDRYGSDSSITPYTVGNHLDDVHFSMELPPPEDGAVNLHIEKTINGLDEAAAQALLAQLQFTVDGTAVTGDQFKNFTANGDNSFTASYQVQIDIGTATSVTKTVEESLATANVEGYTRTTTVATNGGTSATGNRASVTIWNQETGVVSFVNNYEPQTVSLALQKVDQNQQPLAGATFSLEMWGGESWLDSRSITVDTYGAATVSDLRYGTLYRLQETVAPDGYYKLETPVYLKITRTDGTVTLHPCDADGNIVSEWPSSVTADSGDTVGLQIANRQGMILPETGGIGTHGIRWAGLGVVLLSMVFAGYTRSKREKGGSRQRSS